VSSLLISAIGYNILWFAFIAVSNTFIVLTLREWI